VIDGKSFCLKYNSLDNGTAWSANSLSILILFIMVFIIFLTCCQKKTGMVFTL